jgi:hypothetical protein
VSRHSIDTDGSAQCGKKRLLQALAEEESEAEKQGESVGADVEETD